MSEKKGYDPRLVRIGTLLTEKRKALGKQYHSREHFIEERARELFGGDAWISLRHLSNIEAGKNWISLELLIQHAAALEIDPAELFTEILRAYRGDASRQADEAGE